MSLTEELKNDLTRNAEKKGHLVQNCGLWIQIREEARRAEDAARLAEDAAREADNAFKKELGKFMEPEEAGDMRNKEVAEKGWQASQSENLDGDVQYILQALNNCCWAKKEKHQRKHGRSG